MRTFLVTWLALALALPAAGDDGLPAEALARVKEATVFIKAGGRGPQKSGSGFLFHVDHGVGLIATCEHVVTPPPAEDLPPTKVVVVLRSGQGGSAPWAAWSSPWTESATWRSSGSAGSGTSRSR